MRKIFISIFIVNMEFGGLIIKMYDYSREKNLNILIERQGNLSYFSFIYEGYYCLTFTIQTTEEKIMIFYESQNFNSDIEKFFLTAIDVSKKRFDFYQNMSKYFYIKKTKYIESIYILKNNKIEFDAKLKNNKIVLSSYINGKILIFDNINDLLIDKNFDYLKWRLSDTIVISLRKITRYAR
jgi:hypothetical protein